ncbi:MAG: hypoxanthine phosphoribosyltransferase [Ruminococcaceae bacterium]|nr:hypoxanthine phosphoribosyltransferase [Oscillospiraceae bacterium]
MHKDVERVLVSEKQIDDMLTRLGNQITKDYEGKELVVLSVLKGGFIFAADLVRKIDVPMQIDFIAASSYGNRTETSGIVQLKKDTDIDMAGKHLLIVEDIVDSGVTLSYLKKLFESRNAASVKICTAFDKPARRIAKELKIDYVGAVIEDEFVVGYGLDYAEKMRNMPELYVLKRSVYEQED